MKNKRARPVRKEEPICGLVKNFNTERKKNAVKTVYLLETTVGIMQSLDPQELVNFLLSK